MYQKVLPITTADRDRVAPQNRFWLVLDGPIRLEDGTRPDVDRRLAANAVGVAPEDDGVTISKTLRAEGGEVVLGT